MRRWRTKEERFAIGKKAILLVLTRRAALQSSFSCGLSFYDDGRGREKTERAFICDCSEGNFQSVSAWRTFPLSIWLCSCERREIIFRIMEIKVERQLLNDCDRDGQNWGRKWPINSSCLCAPFLQLFKFNFERSQTISSPREMCIAEQKAQ